MFASARTKCNSIHTSHHIQYVEDLHTTVQIKKFTSWYYGTSLLKGATYYLHHIISHVQNLNGDLSQQYLPTSLIASDNAYFKHPLPLAALSCTPTLLHFGIYSFVFLLNMTKPSQLSSSLLPFWLRGFKAKVFL